MDTEESLDEENADLQTRRLGAHEGFKTEATNIQRRRKKVLAEKRAAELLADMPEEQKQALKEALDE